jgi:hypothetical protein
VLEQYREVWAADFEFAAPSGERPSPVCMVARELHSGRIIRLWKNELGPAPPFSTGADVLFVAYYASAELGCFRVLSWPTPANILDLFTEFRDRTNGLALPAGSGLIGALTYFGLDTIGAQGKTETARALPHRSRNNSRAPPARPNLQDGAVGAISRD